MLQVGNIWNEAGVLFIGRILCFGALAGLSVMDLRRRRLPVNGLILMSAGVAASCVLFGRGQLYSCIAGAMVGGVFFLISKATGEGIGYGDSWILCILGAFWGIWEFLEFLFVLWVLVAGMAIVVIAIKKFRKGTAFPMMPLITLSYLVVWISEICQKV